MEVLEEAGLASRADDVAGPIWRERFRGRLIFPIHDDRGRAVGFGGRILAASRAGDRGPGTARRQVPEHTGDGAFPQANDCSTRPTWRGQPAARRAGLPWSRATRT